MMEGDGMAKGQYCVAHPEEPSTGRCIQCHRPFCDTCAVYSEHGGFCSSTCAQRYADYRERNPAPEVPRRSVLGLIVKLVILALIAYAVYAFVLRDRLAGQDITSDATGAATSPAAAGNR
jgi:hypothetical protein